MMCWHKVIVTESVSVLVFLKLFSKYALTPCRIRHKFALRMLKKYVSVQAYALKLVCLRVYQFLRSYNRIVTCDIRTTIYSTNNHKFKFILIITYMKYTKNIWKGSRFQIFQMTFSELVKLVIQ